MDRRYRDESWLRERYHGDGRTQAEIADECGVSASCVRKWMREHGIETRDVEGENHGLYGRERDEETKRRIAESLEGREFDAETRERMSESHEGKTLDESTRERIAESLRGTSRDEKTRRKMSSSTAGRANPNWRGGYSHRYGDGWSVARDAARKRDGVCQHCGHDGSERRLEVHHVVPVRVFRETDGVDVSDAHVLENLVLLCKSCHGKADQDVLEFPVPVDAVPDEIGEIYK
jgi:5-methylcytosine-specific restriction endonuclease McrA